MPNPKRTVAISMAPLAVLLLAVGCGEDSGPLSADELVSTGDQICRIEQRQFTEIQANAPETAAEGVAQTERLIDVSNDSLDELGELEAPTDLEGRFERYLEARRRALRLLERGRDAAERHDRVGYVAAQDKSVAGGAERRKLARAVGFETCGAEGPAGAPPR